MAQVQLLELYQALEGVESDVAEVVPAEPQLGYDGKSSEGLLGQICHRVTVEIEFLETVESPERFEGRPRNVVVSEAEGAQGEEVVEAAAREGVPEVVVVEVEVQKRVHGWPRLATY